MLKKPYPYSQITLQAQITNFIKTVQRENKKDQDYEYLENFFRKNKIKFMNYAKEILGMEEYASFIRSMKIINIEAGVKLLDKGKKCSDMYVLVKGSITYNEQRLLRQNEVELNQLEWCQVGDLLGSIMLISPKYSPYTLLVETPALLLNFSEDVYLRYFKKIYPKQSQQLCQDISRTLIFQGITYESLRKYLPYFFQQTYKYNDLVYNQNTTSIYYIKNGTIQIIRNNTKIVTLSNGEIFGMESQILSSQYSAKVCSPSLEIVVIKQKLFTALKNLYPFISDNVAMYLQKIISFYDTLFQKNTKILNQSNQINLLKFHKKKKKKKRKNKKMSFEWWGVTEDIMSPKKKRIPSYPEFESNQKRKIQGKRKSTVPTMQIQIQKLRKKILQRDIENFKNNESEDEQENISHWKTCYVPKLQKIKVQAVDRPKLTNNAEKIKKKLISYAKRDYGICDSLNLE